MRLTQLFDVPVILYQHNFDKEIDTSCQFHIPIKMNHFRGVGGGGGVLSKKYLFLPPKKSLRYWYETTQDSLREWSYRLYSLGRLSRLTQNICQFNT
jgi:hypothetical protein